ncbi:MAG: AI-2E family transporter [Sphingobacteriales bacterium]|nr:MAG: AI-2E family transporter [Sphingobacteriales bacterium]
MNFINSDNLKQYLLIALIVVLGITLGKQLFEFFPGLLGAVTLYILMRQYFFNLTVIKSWKKWVAATVFILGSMVVFVLPVILMIQVLLPRFSEFTSDPAKLTSMLDTLTQKLKHISPMLDISSAQISSLIQKLTASVPSVLGATLNMLTNAVLAFFILYFMLVDGRKMEYTIQKYLPLQDGNIDDIWNATRVMVVSNAIGIPLLAACQAVVAMLGYWIFGIDSFILWGVLTGVFSLVPIIGTAVIWIPLCLYLFVTGQSGNGIGLLFYSLLITGSVDNILRFTILKKLGDVHPIITALGIIVGIPLFGFMGFIFGPLLISYFLLLIKIYRVEFAPRNNAAEKKEG